MAAFFYNVRMCCGLAGLSVRTENVHNLVLVKLCHKVACGTAVFAGIELAGFLIEDLADSGCEGETAVGVDIDLAHSALGRLAELLLGDTYRIGQFATVGVDDVDIFLGN